MHTTLRSFVCAASLVPWLAGCEEKTYCNFATDCTPDGGSTETATGKDGSVKGGSDHDADAPSTSTPVSTGTVDGVSPPASSVVGSTTATTSGGPPAEPDVQTSNGADAGHMLTTGDGGTPGAPTAENVRDEGQYGPSRDAGDNELSPAMTEAGAPQTETLPDSGVVNPTDDSNTTQLEADPPVPDEPVSLPWLTCGGVYVDPNIDDDYCGATDCEGVGAQCSSAELCVVAACREWSELEPFDVGDSSYNVVFGASDDGETLAAGWTQMNSEGDNQQFMGRVIRNGIPSTAEIAPGVVTSPHLVVSSDGQTVAAFWTQTDSSNPWFDNVYVALWNGGEWTRSKVSSDPVQAGGAKLLLNRDGSRAFIVWRERTNPDGDPEGPCRRVQGSAWDGTEWREHELSNDAPGEAQLPLIALSSGGEAAFVSWHEEHEGSELELHVGRMTVDSWYEEPFAQGFKPYAVGLCASQDADTAAIAWFGSEEEPDPEKVDYPLRVSIGDGTTWYDAPISANMGWSVDDVHCAVTADGVSALVTWTESGPPLAEPNERRAFASWWDGATWSDTALSSAGERVQTQSLAQAVSEDGSVAMIGWKTQDEVRVATWTASAWSTRQIATPPEGLTLGDPTVHLAPNGQAAFVIWGHYSNSQAGLGTVHASVWNRDHWNETLLMDEPAPWAGLESHVWVDNMGTSTIAWPRRSEGTSLEALLFSHFR